MFPTPKEGDKFVALPKQKKWADRSLRTRSHATPQVSDYFRVDIIERTAFSLEAKDGLSLLQEVNIQK